MHPTRDYLATLTLWDEGALGTRFCVSADYECNPSLVHIFEVWGLREKEDDYGDPDWTEPLIDEGDEITHEDGRTDRLAIKAKCVIGYDEMISAAKGLEALFAATANVRKFA